MAEADFATATLVIGAGVFGGDLIEVQKLTMVDRKHVFDITKAATSGERKEFMEGMVWTQGSLVGYAKDDFQHKTGGVKPDGTLTVTWNGSDEEHVYTCTFTSFQVSGDWTAGGPVIIQAQFNAKLTE